MLEKIETEVKNEAREAVMFRKKIFSFCLILAFFSPLWTRAESPKARLAELVAQLQKGPDSFELRKNIILLVSGMKNKPETPEELDELMGKAKAIMKDAKSPEDFKQAAEVLHQASLLAPWDGDLYYNCGVVREKSNEPLNAINDFNLYLLANPRAKDRKKVKERLGALEYEAEKAKAADNLEGAVFVYVMPESMNPNGTTEFKMTINGGQVTQTATYTHVTDQGVQNGARMGEIQPMGTGQLEGKLFKMPLDSVTFAYYLISPDGQTISRCDPNGNLVDVGNPNMPVFKRVP